MEITNRLVSELIPAEYNPRTISEKEFSDLLTSFKNLGTIEPAIINIHPDRKNIIIAGHQRIKAAKHLGMDTFPCIEVNFTLDREREANIRMNRNHGSFDMDILLKEFHQDDLTEFGFEISEFELDSPGNEKEVKFTPSSKFTIKCKSKQELENLKKHLGADSNKVEYEDFIRMLANTKSAAVA